MPGGYSQSPSELQTSEILVNHSWLQKLMKKAQVDEAALSHANGFIPSIFQLCSQITKTLTCDPDDVQYMASTKSSNFIRGPKSKKNFDLLGDSVFNAEGAEWSYHLRIIRVFFSAANEDPEAGIDLQELFQRFFYDMSFQMTCGHDPNSLSLQ
ncbi:Alkane hydroxylase MAH1-like protein [Drosera capensis]